VERQNRRVSRPDRCSQCTRKPVIEVCNALDAGLRLLVGSGERRLSEHTLEVVIAFLRGRGVRASVTSFSAIPSFVGSLSGEIFLLCSVGCLVCHGTDAQHGPPHRPDKTRRARYQTKPTTGGAYRPITRHAQKLKKGEPSRFLRHDRERPHQGRSCGNVPASDGLSDLTHAARSQPRTGWNPDAWLTKVES